MRAIHAALGGLIEFVRYFWHVLEPVTPFVDGWCLRGMCEHLEAVTNGKILRLLMNVSPGFMKSLLTNVFWPAWEWGPRGMAHLRTVSFSYSSTLTERDNEKFLYLLQSREYQELYGKGVIITKEGVQRISNTMRGWKFASSVGGTGTGERGDRVTCDDAHNVKEAESDTVRQATVRWFDETMQNRINDPKTSAIVVIGQRVHGADVSQKIIEEYPDYVHFCVPMEYDGRDIVDGAKIKTKIGWEDPRWDDGDLAWEERYDNDYLDGFRKNAFLWNGQYQQSPSIRGGSIIRDDDWKIWDRKAMAANDVKPGLFPPFEFVLASLDGAFTEKKENDYNALTIWGVWIETSIETRFNEQFGTPRLMLIWAWRKRLTLHGKTVLIRPGETKEEFGDRRRAHWGVVEHVAADCKKFKVNKLIIENKANGFDVAHEMRRLYADESWVTALDDPGRLDKVARAWTVQPLWADGVVWRPDTDWGQDVQDELSRLPRGAHDDLADSAVAAVRHLNRMGMARRRDESHAAIEEMIYPSIGPPKRLGYEV